MGLKNLIKSKYALASIVFIFLGLLPRAVNFILLPVYLNYLDASNYGMLVLYNLYSALFIVFGILQLNIAAGAQYFKKGLDKDEYRAGILITAILVSIFVIILFSIGGNQFFRLYSSDISFFPLGFITLLTALFSLWETMIFSFLKNDYKIKTLGLFSVSVMLLSVSIQVYFLVVEDWGVSGIIYGALIAKIIVIPILFFYHRKWFKISLSILKAIKKYGVMALRFSIPFVPAVAIHWAQTYGDRLIIEKFATLETVGQYSILVAILIFPQMMVNSIINSIKPKLFELMNQGKKALVEKIDYLLPVLVILALSISLLIGTHLHLITDNIKYTEIKNYLFTGIIAIIPGSLVYLPHLKLMAMDKTGLISKYSFFAVSLQIALLILIVPHLGINGAIISLGVGGLLNLVLNTQASFKEYPYSIGKFSIPILGMIAINMLGQAFIKLYESDIILIAEIAFVGILIMLFFTSRKNLKYIINYF